MSRTRMQADWKDAAVRCWRCGGWPATVKVDSKRRICETCAHAAKQVKPLQ